MDKPRILILDIETQAALVETFGLWNQNIGIKQIRVPVRVICFAAQWWGKKKIMFHAEWLGGKEAMLQAAWDLLNKADYVVGWNSKKFDLPHLRGEFLVAGMKPPAPHKDVDLMLVAKRNFRLMSNKLDWYAQQLGVGSKIENGGMALWSTLSNPGSAKDLREAQKLMARYNKADVALTGELFDQMRPWANELNFGLFDDTDHVVCPSCGSDDLKREGYALTTAGKFQRRCCRDCGKWSRDAKRVATTPLRSIS